jgi:MoxR-like ATPase
MRAAQAHAAIHGGTFVKPDDVKAMASAVLSHRAIPRAESRARGHSSEQIIDGLLETVPTPLPVG